MTLQVNNSHYIVFIKNTTDDTVFHTVYNTKEQYEEALNDYKKTHINDSYIAKVIYGEIIKSEYNIKENNNDE